MKKILTVSLFAVMAVSAAHAKIASVEYVDPKFQAINEKIGEVTYDGASLSAAISALQTDVGAMTGTGDNSVSNQINTAKQEAIDAAAADATTKAKNAQAAAEATAAADATSKANAAEANAKEYADDGLLLKEDVANKVASDTAYGQLSEDQKAKAYPTYGAMVTFVRNVQTDLNTDVAANTNAIEILNGDENEEGSVAAAVKAEADRAKLAEQANTDAITNITKDGGTIDTKVKALADGAVQANTTAIANMDLTSQGAAGKFVSGVSQSDGLVSESLTDFASEVVEGGQIAPKAGAVYTAVEGAKSYTDTAISNLTAQDKVPEVCRGNDAKGNPIRCALIAVDGALQWEVVEY